MFLFSTGSDWIFLLPVFQCCQLMAVSPRQIVQLLQFVENPGGSWRNDNAPEVEQNRFLRRHRTWKLQAADLETLQFVCSCSSGGSYQWGLLVLPSGLTDAVAPPTGRAQSCSVMLGSHESCSHCKPFFVWVIVTFLFVTTKSPW